MSKNKQTLITSRDPKGIALTGLFEATLNKTKLDADGAQRIFEHGDELQAGITKLLKELSVSNQFANEEVESSYTYPDGYSLRTLEQQTYLLRQSFPELSLGMDVAHYVTHLNKFRSNTELPTGAKGFFIIQRWQKVAPTYGEALEKVLALLTKSRKFYNYRDGQLGEKKLRQSVRTSEMLAKLTEGQPGDFIIIPAQVGMKHRGHSVRRARELFTANEFGLDAFTVACILLTHPEREQVWEQLHIDCSGDEYSPDADGQFDSAPYFCFRDGGLKFDASWIGNVSGRYGSASGFLPQ